MTAKTDFCESLLATVDDNCVRWPWRIHRSGYGCLYLGQRFISAPRYVCILKHGEPEGKLDAAHSCGNRWCVNPLHLSWKTRAANAADRVIHGTTDRGERNANARLTDELVRYIRQTNKTAVDLARELGISSVTINHARRGRTWAHVEASPQGNRAALLRQVPEDAAKRLSEGVTQAQVAREFGVSAATAHRWSRLTDPERKAA